MSSMFDATITLEWPDGSRAVAVLQAGSPDADYPVKYTGDVDRLAAAPKQADYAFLAFSLKVTAKITGAKYSEQITRRVRV